MPAMRRSPGSPQSEHYPPHKGEAQMQAGIPSRERRHFRATEDQECPMCGVLVAKGAGVCRACGADLTRSGVVLSTVTPIVRHSLPKKRQKNPITITAIALLCALGVLAFAASLSPIGAHVPGLQVIHALPGTAYQRVAGWGKLLQRPQAVKPPQETALPEPSASGVAPAETATLASVTILSDPADAQVSVDDTASGATPLTLEKVAPGLHKVSIQRTGYQPAVRTFTVAQGESLTLSMTLNPTGRPALRPAPKSAAKPVAAASRKPQPLQIGAHAPEFVLKDRIGVIYRLDDMRGQRVAVLLVWSLDASAQGAIRDFANRTGKRAGQFTPIVIALNPNRVAIRQFITSEQIRVPILFGNPNIAEQYGVSPGTSLLYVISEQGIIVQRHRAVGQLASLGLIVIE